jgi:hypothetical protein
MTILRELEYKGRLILSIVLPQQGRWAYRIEDGPLRMLRDARGAREEDLLFEEAQRAAKAEIDRVEKLGTSRAKPH